MEERKKKPIPLPLIVLVVLLVVGVLLAVVLLQGPLADTGNQGERTPEKAREECASLLKEADYAGVAELYDSVSEYPQAQGEIKRQLREHVYEIVMEQDLNRLPAVCNALQTEGIIFEVVLEGLEKGVADLMKDSYPDMMVYYQHLRDLPFHLEELDAHILKTFKEGFESGNSYKYGDVSHYFSILFHCDYCKAEMQQMVENKVAQYLKQGDYESACLLLSRADYWEFDQEPICLLLKEEAYALYDRGEYAGARYLLLKLRDEPDVPGIFDLEAQLRFRMSVLQVYIAEGEFAEAEKWAMSFAGETREKLQAALLQHTADREFIEAIEAAVLSRMEMEAADTAWRMILDKELELLRDYRNRYFVDDTMKQLLMDYLDAVDGQRKTLFWEQTAEAADYFQQMEDKRLATLRTLARDYGFGEGDERLQNLLNRK